MCRPICTIVRIHTYIYTDIYMCVSLCLRACVCKDVFQNLSIVALVLGFHFPNVQQSRFVRKSLSESGFTVEVGNSACFAKCFLRLISVESRLPDSI